MELNDAFISILDSMGTIATIAGTICLAIGIATGVVFQRFTPALVGILMLGFLVSAPDFVKAVVGREEPSEHAQVLDDGSSIDIGDDSPSFASFFGLALVFNVCILVWHLVWHLVKESSVQDEDDALVESNHNQSPSPPEEIVLPNTQLEPEPQSMSSSVGALKSTRKIQLD